VLVQPAAQPGFGFRGLLNLFPGIFKEKYLYRSI